MIIDLLGYTFISFYMIGCEHSPSDTSAPTATADAVARRAAR